MRNLKPVSLFVFFFAQAPEMIFIKTQSIKKRCYRTGKYTVCRRIRASLSPKILQSWAVKGLSSGHVKLNCSFYRLWQERPSSDCVTSPAGQTPGSLSTPGLMWRTLIPPSALTSSMPSPSSTPTVTGLRRLRLTKIRELDGLEGNHCHTTNPSPLSSLWTSLV